MQTQSGGGLALVEHSNWEDAARRSYFPVEAQAEMHMRVAVEDVEVDYAVESCRTAPDRMRGHSGSVGCGGLLRRGVVAAAAVAGDSVGGSGQDQVWGSCWGARLCGCEAGTAAVAVVAAVASWMSSLGQGLGCRTRE